MWVFTGLVVLIISWASYTTWQQYRLTSALEIMNTQHVRLVETTTDLLEAAYNRHQSVVAQVITEDPFKRDEFRAQYDHWGNRVGAARRVLLKEKLDQTGQKNLQLQAAMIPQIIALQEQIVDLATAGKSVQAELLLANKLRDLDASFDLLVQDLRRHEQDKIIMYSQQVRTLATQIQVVTIILGVIIILIVIGLGLSVYRSLRKRGHEIVAQGRQLEQASRLLIHDATHDALTGLANRRLFFECLQQAITLSKQEGYSIGVAYIDLDKFKPINDQYGHAAGDALLKTIAHRLLSQLREIDTVARLGGDEFAIILMHASTAAMDQLIHTLRQRICQPIDIGHHITIQPAFAVGYALCPEHGTDADTLLAKADEAMYSNKRSKLN